MTRPPTPSSKRWIANYFKVRNPWLDWQSDTHFAPMNWMSLAGLMLRRIDPDKAMRRIEPEIRASIAALVPLVDELIGEGDPLAVHEVAGNWIEDRFVEQLQGRLPEALSGLANDPDSKYFVQTLRISRANWPAFMVFLMESFSWAAQVDDNEWPKDDPCQWIIDLVEDVDADDIFPALVETVGRQVALHLERPISIERGWRAEYSIHGIVIDQDLIGRAERERDGRLPTRPPRSKKPGATQGLPANYLTEMRGGQGWVEIALGRTHSPVCWEVGAAFALRDVPIGEFVERLMPTISEMERLTAEAVEAEIEASARKSRKPLSPELWLKHWRAHFTHSPDPITRILMDLCTTPDAHWFIDNATQYNAPVVANFLLRIAAFNETTKALLMSEAVLEGSTGREVLFPVMMHSTVGDLQPMEALAMARYDAFAEESEFKWGMMKDDAFAEVNWSEPWDNHLRT